MLILRIILHIVAGLLLTTVVTVVGVYAGVYTTSERLTEDQFYERGLLASLLIWFMVAATCMIACLRQIKLDRKSFLLRQVFLWGPISIAWYFTARGYDGILPIGMTLSSAVLVYETRVWWGRRKE